MRIETTIVTDETGAEVERIELKQYTLAELREQDDSSGYDRALEKLAEGAMDDTWWDVTLDSDVDHIEGKYGIRYDPKNVSFDLDRGSFFSFGRADVTDDRKVLRLAGVDLRTKEARAILDEGGLSVGATHWYGNERGWIGTHSEGSMPDEVSEATAERISQVLADAEHEMLKTLRDEQEYLTSEEALAETAEANEYRFYNDGRMA